MRWVAISPYRQVPPHARHHQPPAGIYDELLLAHGSPRLHGRGLTDWLRRTDAARLTRKRAEADLLFRRTGTTFNVYGDAQGAERLIPFDIVPRPIPAHD
ncbi:MAG: hypothetical protein ACOY9J_07505 [Pseudomonadota bacterium]